MIKPTFYKLPIEKRERIIDVTKKEFSKGKKQKITINNVIAKAGISRGSFYQYFDDKLDLVQLVADDMFKKMTEYIKQELLINSGDIFEIAIKIFDLINTSTASTEISLFTPDSNQNSALISDYMQFRYREVNPFTDIIKYINTDNFKDKSPENVECVVTLLFDQIKTAVFNVQKGIVTAENAKKSLINKVNIIKYGSLNA